MRFLLRIAPVLFFSMLAIAVRARADQSTDYSNTVLALLDAKSAYNDAVSEYYAACDNYAAAEDAYNLQGGDAESSANLAAAGQRLTNAANSMESTYQAMTAAQAVVDGYGPWIQAASL